jgi:alpha,alpha-trehalose phosphorylase
VAALSYWVTVVNADTFVIISSEMATNRPTAPADLTDPRQTRPFAGRVLHPQTSYSKDRRIVLCHATENSHLMVACGTDHLLETTCSHASRVVHKHDFGQVAFTVEARSDSPIHLTKFMVYRTSRRASAEELCGRLEFTIDHAMARGLTTCSWRFLGCVDDSQPKPLPENRRRPPTQLHHQAGHDQTAPALRGRRGLRPQNI